MAESYPQDFTVWPTMERLSTCLCAELGVEGFPPLCFCGVIPGGAVVQDFPNGDCKGGMAWVRLLNMYPSVQQFPAPDPTGNCVNLLGFPLEVGCIRQAPMPTNSGRKPPSVQAQAEAVQLQLADAAAMRRAINCCLAAGDVDAKYVVTDYTPVGPEGNVVGGAWTVIVQEGISVG